MIKKYLEFINESEVNGFNSIGEWVESLYNDDYIKNIVNRYISDIDPDIRVSNSINILDDITQKEIKSQIEEYLKDGIEDKKPSVITSVETDVLESVTLGGKGIFTSFLKSLTALGQKDTTSDINRCPDDFLIFYNYPNLNSDDVKSIFSRFKSLSMYIDLVDYSSNITGLYFGIKLDGTFEYGFSYDELIQIGQFRLSQSIVKWIVQIDSKSASKLKKDLVNLTFKDITTLCKIKQDMTSFNPGYHEGKSKPKVEDRVISFGYYGVGKWDNGVLDEGELLNVKNNLSTFILSKRWGGDVLISVKPNSFWLYIHIKIK